MQNPHPSSHTNNNTLIGGLGSSSELATDSKKIGIIIPPPALKRTIEVTAEHIVSSKIPEKQLLSSNENTFNFLLPENPYNKYYKHIVEKLKKFKTLEEEFENDEFKDDDDDFETLKSEKSEITVGNISKSASVAFYMNRSREKPTRDPFEYFYDTTIPSSIKPLELDIIKLTAQYTAANGKQFMFEIASLESSNPQFDFLKPNHRHFHFFTKLVDIYTGIIYPDRLTPMQIQKYNQENNIPNNPNSELQQIPVKPEDHIFKYLNMFSDSDKKLQVLDMLLQKAEWELIQEENQRKEQLGRDEDKSVFDMIDWQDFIVVQTIDFDEDINEIEMDDEEEEEEINEQELVEPEENIYENMYPSGFADSDMNQMETNEDENVNPAEPTFTDIQEENRMNDEDEDEEELDPSRFARTYQPQKGVKSSTPLMFKDKKTGELIPVDRAEKHLKVSTINPQYFEQKEREKAKREKTNIAPGIEMTKVIASWNEDSETQEGSSVGTDQIWDGYTSSIMRTTNAALSKPRKETAPQNQLGPQTPTEYFKQEQEKAVGIAQMAATMALKEMMKQNHDSTLEEPESKKRREYNDSDNE